MLAILAQVASNAFSFTDDPVNLLAVRDTLADLAEGGMPDDQ